MATTGFDRYDFGKKCVCVGRVSTSSQSQTAQTSDLEEFAHRRGYDKIKVFFTTESGFLEYDKKQGWNLVTDFFDSHKDYKVLIVPEISRLSRKEHILHIIKDYLITNKIQLIIKDINFTLFNEFGQVPKGNDVIFALYASLADSEMRQKKERFKRALHDLRIQGFSIGGKVLFGYTRHYELKDGKMRSTYRINETEREEIIQIYKWYAYGIDGDLRNTTILTITQECIARGFSKYLHSKRNVNKCLKEEAYTGCKTTHNRTPNPEYHNYKKMDAPKYVNTETYICKYPIIFDGELANLPELVKSRMQKNNSRYSDGSEIDKSRKHTTILARLLPCPICGRYLVAEYRKRGNGWPSYTYRCAHSRGVIEKCGFSSIISMRMIDSVVWGYCRAKILDLIEADFDKQNAKYLSDIESKIHNAKAELDNFDYKGRVEATKRMFKAIVKKTGVYDDADLNSELDKINEEYKIYQDTLKRCEEQKRNCIALGDYKKMREEVVSLTNSKQRIYDWLHRIVHHVEIVATDKFYTIVRIHFLNSEVSKYIFIRKRSSQYIQVFEIIAYNSTIVNQYVNALPHLNDSPRLEYLTEQFSYDLIWKKEQNKFISNGLEFTPDDVMARVPKYKKPIFLTEEDICAVHHAVSDIRLQKKISKFLKEKGSETKIEFTLKELEYNKLDFYKEDLSC